ncbi:MAG TPA: translation factor GTPase family protein [Ktedonobacterales bacterium]|nr:translation factor GTPase family protein [Ktedonobacterales bacterium]
MLRRTLNLGILAHVDAGKTTLTERLLYTTGAIAEIGSVDAGTTQTDSLALEQQRGITIRSAVASFDVDDLAVNLIDTPGHPDFIAEVERALRVLDGAVLVISAVEGVQAQTTLLMRALQRLHTPTLIFVNKIDRSGADSDRVMCAITGRLSSVAIPMGSVRDLGTRAAAFTLAGADDAVFMAWLATTLAEHDDALLAAYLDDERSIPYLRLRQELSAQTQRALVYPVFFGSAHTGAGVGALIAGIAELLPAVAGAADGPLSGAIFKIERGATGEKIAWVRMFSGVLRLRDRVRLHETHEGKVTAIKVFERGQARRSAAITAGQIAQVWGLTDAQIGDAIGLPRTAPDQEFFAPPTLETVIVPQRPSDKSALHAAFAQLAEQDPLIHLRQDDIRGELYVSLYGEVQKEVIQATLATDFGVEVEFRDTTPICIERVIGSGSACELLGAASNPFLATLGLRIDPAPVNTGVTFQLQAAVGSIPLFIYKTVESFSHAIEETVRETLRQGLHGWQVTDCTVTVTDSGYTSPSSSAADFRKLTPLVLMSALQQANTQVDEPIYRFRLDGPVDALQPTLRALAQLRADPSPPSIANSSFVVEGEIAAVQMRLLQGQLRGLTHGEGALEFAFGGYRPVEGPIPTRLRTDNNPLNRKEYLLRMARRFTNR